jgi:AsmA protein
MTLIIRILGACVVAVLLIVIGIMMLPQERIVRVAVDQIERATGRQVSIAGEVSVTFWPVLGASVSDLTLGNPAWASEPAMLTAKQVRIGVDAAALLSGNVTIKNIEARSPVVHLESRADGRASWLFTDDGAEATETTTTSVPATIEKLSLTDATVIYDAEGTDRLSVEGFDLSLNWPDQNDPARLQTRIAPNGSDVSLDATIDGFAGFVAGQVQDIDLTLGTAGGEVRFSGRGATSGDISGKLAVKTEDTGRFLGAVGAGDVVIPGGFGQVAQIDTALTLTNSTRLALRDLVADFGGNILRGAADVQIAAVPEIQAELSTNMLDLRVLGSDAANTDVTRSSDGWSTAPIDASALAAFNGTVALRAGRVDLDTLSLGSTDVVLNNDRARMVFGLQQVAAYGGTLSGEFVVNTRNGLSVGGQLAARGVELKPLLTDLADLERFTGQGDADISFLGVGQYVDAIMRSLSGGGSLTVGRGTIEGIDLDDLLGSFDVQGGTTVFDNLAASFSINGGVLRNNDLRMILPNFETTGAGQVDLGGRTLDYTVTPKALRVNEGRGLAVPVRISGPWADPRIRPDLNAAIDLNFQEEKDRVEERVTQQIEEKLEEELGVVREEGQSVEDALRDQVEDKLKEELLRLFD